MNEPFKKFSEEDLQKILDADDLKISPLRADGITYGAAAWLWCVAVEGNLYVRAYNGLRSRWYQAAMRQRKGRIQSGDIVREVWFEPFDDALINPLIDEAYKKKYRTNQYLYVMMNEKARASTVNIVPL